MSDHHGESPTGFSLHTSGSPHITIFSTGGTIASTHGDRGLLPSATSADLLRQCLAQAEDLPHTQLEKYLITTTDLFSLDSSQLSWEHLDCLHQAVTAELAKQPEGIVILHGTDTLETTAMWLALTAHAAEADVPVILTGANFSADNDKADGPANLALALQAIVNHNTRKGVQVAFGGRIWGPWALVKRSTNTTEAFWSPSQQPGFYTDPTQETPFPALPLECIPVLSDPDSPLPYVRVITADFADDGSMLPAAFHDPHGLPVAGLVIEGLGSGNVPGPFAERLLALHDCFPDTAILMTTRVPFGPVEPLYDNPGGGSALVKKGILYAGSLRAPQCRILLTTLLAAGFTHDDLRELLGCLP